MADAFFSDAVPAKARKASMTHSMSGRRHKQPDRPELAQGGFFPLLAPLAAAVAPSLVGFAAKKILGQGQRAPNPRARLSGHELGFQSFGSASPSSEEAYFGEGTKKGQMRKTARRAYEGAGAAEGAFGEGMYGGMMRGGMYASHTGGVETGGAVTGGRKKRAPSARNLAVKKVMRERGVSLPEASRIVKQEGLA